MRRIWDEYLTEDDRAALAAAPERADRVWGFGNQPALILVDLYRAVYGDRPESLLDAMSRWPQSCGLSAWAAIPAIQSALDAARNHSVPVIHVTGLSGSGIEPWSRRANGGETPSVTPAGFDPYEIMPQFKPTPGEAVVRKLAPSAFFGTLLMAHLSALRIDTIVICGESTSGCVRATVVDGRSYRFNVIVIEEGVFDRHQATHALNLFDMHQKYADVVRLDDFTEALKVRGRLADYTA